MFRFALAILTVSLAACAEDEQAKIACAAVADVPKHLVLVVGDDRAGGMSVYQCEDGCFLASDSDGTVKWCE